MSNMVLVQIKRIENDEVVKEIGPMPEWKADRVVGGIGINLNWDDFYVDVNEVKHEQA